MKKTMICGLIGLSLLNGFEIENDNLYKKILKEKLYSYKNKTTKDKYFGKIKVAKTVYSTTILANIKIDENGNMSYKIVKKSDIEKFNKKIKKHLEKLKKEKYPILKNTKHYTFETKFDAKTIEIEKKDCYEKRIKDTIHTGCY